MHNDLFIAFEYPKEWGKLLNIVQTESIQTTTKKY